MTDGLDPMGWKRRARTGQTLPKEKLPALLGVAPEAENTPSPRNIRRRSPAQRQTPSGKPLAKVNGDGIGMGLNGWNISGPNGLGKPPAVCGSA